MLEALGKIKFLLKAGGLIAPVLIALGAVIPPVALAAVPLIVASMELAERQFGPGTGSEKRAVVLTEVAEERLEVPIVAIGESIDELARVANTWTDEQEKAWQQMKSGEWGK